MITTRPASLELLESRIAPAALTVVNPLKDILVGAGHGNKTIELSQMFDSNITNAGHTIITFTLNLDSDPHKAGIQPTTFHMELFDDEAPLTVQNFLRYVESPTGQAEFLNTFFHRSVSGFVVQGGGFSTSDLKDHINVFASVHNEFGESNLRGTVAMAKTGASENSATSEWFVNLANNSGNLDNQNGGFTVFGKILDQDMGVFDKIAALPKITLAKVNGALTDVPVQNLKKGATPNASNFIRVTGMHIETPEKGNVTGVTYTVESDNPDLVGTELVGSELKLNYHSSKAGDANITITADDGSGPVTETFTVHLTPNLITSVTGDTLQRLLVPGDTGTATVAVQNNGGGIFDGHVDVKFYLSKVDNASDPKGLILDTSKDLLIGSNLDKQLTLASGDTVRLTQDLSLPAFLIDGDPSVYRLLIDVSPAAGESELFTDDNTTFNGGNHGVLNGFGKINFGEVSRSGVTLKYTDPVSNELVTLAMKGQGEGSIKLANGLADLKITGMRASSKLKLTTEAEGDLASFHDVNLSNPGATIDLSDTKVAGSMTINGGSVLLGNLKNYTSISFTGGSQTKLTYNDPVSSDVVTMGFTGAGRGGVTVHNNIADLSISDTNASSLLKLTTAGNANFHQLDVASTIGTLNLRAANFDGPMSISGGAKSLLLGDIGGDNLLSIGAYPGLGSQKLSLTVGRVTDLSIESSQPIGGFKAIDWRDTTGADDSLMALSIASLKITGSKALGIAGDLEANVTSYGEQKLGAISVAGTVKNATIQTSGNIGVVNVGGMDHSKIFAGVSERPDSLSDFAEPHSIGSFTIHAIKGATNQFVSSQVAAANISKIVVRGVDTDNSGSAFGFVADNVGRYTQVGVSSLSKLSTAQTADASGDYGLVIL